MAKDLSPRQHRAITEYIRTGVKARAYLAAGYRASTRSSLDVAACQFFRKVKVKAEIDRRKAAMVKRADITMDKLLSDLAEDRELARRVEQPGAAIQATQLMAKLTGHLIERKETGQPGDFAACRSREEVIAAVRADLGDQAADLLDQLTSGPLNATEALSEPTAIPADELPKPGDAIN